MRKSQTASSPSLSPLSPPRSTLRLATTATTTATATTKDFGDEPKELDSPKTMTTSGALSYDDEHSLDTPPPMHGRLGSIIVSSGPSPDSDRTPGCCSSSNGSSISSNCYDGSPANVNANNATATATATVYATAYANNAQRHRSFRRATTATGNPSDMQPQPQPVPDDDPSYDVLLRALNQLNRLATLDSAEYQQRLLENSLPALQAQSTHSSLYCPSLSMRSSDNQHQHQHHTTTGTTAVTTTTATATSTTTRIGPLPQPIQTPLVQLSMSIHRLHALIANVTREIDGHTDEVQELRSELEALRRRNRKVERVAGKLHKQNLKLKNQSLHDRRMAKGLGHKVSEYEARLESQGFQLMASKVRQHEIRLQLTNQQQQQQSQKRRDAESSSENSNSNNGNGNDNDNGTAEGDRQRFDSTMSDYCDVENDIDGIGGIASVGSDLSETSGESTTGTGTGTRNTPTRKQTEESADDASASCGGAIVSNSRSKSHSNGNNILTLRFWAEPSGEKDASNNSNSNSSSKDPEQEQQEQEHHSSDPSFDVADGCDDEKSTTDDETKDEAPTIQDMASSLSDRFARFLGHRVVSNYNLKMVPPCNLQFVELELKSSRQEHKHENGGEGASIDIGSLDDNTTYGHQTKQKQKQNTAFAVCGFDGFNAEINMKPTVGARLMKLNGQAINDEWTLERLCEELAGNSNSNNNNNSSSNNNNNNSGENARSTTKPIVLTFRNEIWEKAQSEELSKAIRRSTIKATVMAGTSESNGGKMTQGVERKQAISTKRYQNKSEKQEWIGINIKLEIIASWLVIGWYDDPTKLQEEEPLRGGPPPF
eukprot:jgi/Psemu1/10139/gm1.10139_g